MSSGSANTGPAYPAARPSQTLIGQFVPGAQLADIPALQPWDTIVSQYANSPALTGLIEAFFAAVDKAEAMDAFFDNVWNLDTANGYGLEIWGRIVGVGRVLTLSQQAYLAFSQSGAPGVGWSQGPFYSGLDLTYNYRLSDSEFRRLINARALANISDGSIPAINRILLALFPGRGNCWVTELPGIPPYFGFAEAGTAYGFNQAPLYAGGRTVQRGVTYTVTFPLSLVDYGMLASGVIPKPMGVPASVQIV